MDINELREEIRAIDTEMAELFERRMKAAIGVAEYKKERGLPVEDLIQEKRVIDQHLPLIEDEELRSYYLNFLQNTMDVSKKWQHRIMNGQQIAYVGGEDSLDHLAVTSLFPEGSPVSYESYQAAYDSVVSGESDVAVLPFEVGFGTEVGQVVDIMFRGSLHVNAVYTHGSDEDSAKFAVLSRIENEYQGVEQASAFLLMFTVNDETGGLAKAINIISAFDYNMTVLRSRPMKDLPCNYYFYAELIGDDNNDNGRRMINALRVACPSVKVLGRYL